MPYNTGSCRGTRGSPWLASASWGAYSHWPESQSLFQPPTLPTHFYPSALRRSFRSFFFVPLFFLILLASATNADAVCSGWKAHHVYAHIFNSIEFERLFSVFVAQGYGKRSWNNNILHKVVFHPFLEKSISEC